MITKPTQTAREARCGLAAAHFAPLISAARKLEFINLLANKRHLSGIYALLKRTATRYSHTMASACDTHPAVAECQFKARRKPMLETWRRIHRGRIIKCCSDQTCSRPSSADLRTKQPSPTNHVASRLLRHSVVPSQTRSEPCNCRPTIAQLHFFPGAT